MNGMGFIKSIDLSGFTQTRPGETKWGELLKVIRHEEELKTTSARYILLGIPEDIGIRANGGRAGSASAWWQALTVICSMPGPADHQINKLAILGTIICDDLQEASMGLDWRGLKDQEKFHELITTLDNRVSQVISNVIAAGKIPIVIGGGHNNSFGLLKGASQAINQPMHCLNIDTHADFRALEYRHSGNGFSYAQQQGHLSKYGILGLQNAMTSREIHHRLAQHPDLILTATYESIIDKEQSFAQALETSLDFVSGQAFGLEIDLDVIAHMGSSAQSPSGFSLEEVRTALRLIKSHHYCTYIHLCEGAPELGTTQNQVAKALALMVYDTVRR